MHQCYKNPLRNHNSDLIKNIDTNVRGTFTIKTEPTQREFQELPRCTNSRRRGTISGSLSRDRASVYYRTGRLFDPLNNLARNVETRNTEVKIYKIALSFRGEQCESTIVRTAVDVGEPRAAKIRGSSLSLSHPFSLSLVWCAGKRIWRMLLYVSL